MAEKLSEIVERETEPDDEDDDQADDETTDPGETEPDDQELDEDETEPHTFESDDLEAQLVEHAVALERVFGPAWPEMAPCSRCGGVGYMPNTVPDPPPILPDPDLVVCTACNGHGKRETPSWDPQYVTTPCTVCSGSGHRDKAAVEATRQAAEYAAAAAAPAAVPPSGYPPPPQPVWNPVTNQWDIIPAAPGGSVA